ncbi:hypothetical protein EVAR_8180_1 [Eumeta japonica]|uniref:Uncharacterized protein n=1 Tax=Eumeta variegata TaxID=151549 RepID=A0A4C1TI38_EUMVA|nr:hypothetical protein EVAR_8180_1 [Eumeta japonica]
MGPGIRAIEQRANRKAEWSPNREAQAPGHSREHAATLTRGRGARAGCVNHISESGRNAYRARTPPAPAPLPFTFTFQYGATGGGAARPGTRPAPAARSADRTLLAPQQCRARPAPTPRRRGRRRDSARITVCVTVARIAHLECSFPRVKVETGSPISGVVQRAARNSRAASRSPAGPQEACRKRGKWRKRRETAAAPYPSSRRRAGRSALHRRSLSFPSPSPGKPPLSTRIYTARTRLVAVQNDRADRTDDACAFSGPRRRAGRRPPPVKGRAPRTPTRVSETRRIKK